jgi:hypothetical protein
MSQRHYWRGVPATKAVVSEVDPSLSCLPLSIAQQASIPRKLVSEAETSGGPISLHTAIGSDIRRGCRRVFEAPKDRAMQGHGFKLRRMHLPETV